MLDTTQLSEPDVQTDRMMFVKGRDRKHEFCGYVRARLKPWRCRGTMCQTRPLQGQHSFVCVADFDPRTGQSGSPGWAHSYRWRKKS